MVRKLTIPKPLVAPLPQVTRKRPLLPLQIPTLPAVLPSLPSPPRTDAPLGPSWVLSTHIVPAAYPRSTPAVPVPPLISDDEKDRKAAAARLGEQILANSRDYIAHPPTEEKRNKAVMWNCANRFVRSGRRRAGNRPVTLFFTHANGFHKETWEPTLKTLVQRIDSASNGMNVDEIWTWDVANHGDAALLNAPHLGGVFDWADAARDINNFLLHYLPRSARSNPLPTHLPLVSKTETAKRKTRGFTERTLVVVGHSLGGGTTILAAHDTPILFDSVVLIDPPMEHASRYTATSYIQGSAKRRERWASRDAARAQFEQSPFFQAWDPAVLDAYVKYALTEDENGGVKLKTPSIQEIAVFADHRGPGEAYDRIADLDPRIPLHWIMPATPTVAFNPDAASMAYEFGQLRVWRRLVNASNVCITGCGHLITQEAPEKLAHEIADFLESRYGSDQTPALIAKM